MGKRIFITAAEVSGDIHASHLIESLLAIDPTHVIEGHGGPRMRAAGAHIYTETTAKAAMGLSALGRVKDMFALLRWTRGYFATNPPDIQICVDSPSLNFHFAKIAHSFNRPVLCYVAPQLWAWREGRMKKVRKWVDHLACILPFEEPYFRSHGVTATFVGHPLFDELRPVDSPPPVRAFADEPVIGLLTGSRKSEAVANFPRMLEVSRQVRKAFPKARFLVPTTGATHPIVEAVIAQLPDRSAYVVETDAFDRFVPQCDLVITVSGTATLHVAIHNAPMIVVYTHSPLLWHGLGRWLIKTRTYALVNLLAADPKLASSGRVTSDMHIVPEYVPWFGPTEPLAEHAVDLLRNPDKLGEQKGRLTELVNRLHSPGASMNTARLAMELLEKRPS